MIRELRRSRGRVLRCEAPNPSLLPTDSPRCRYPSLSRLTFSRNRRRIFSDTFSAITSDRVSMGPLRRERCDRPRARSCRHLALRHRAEVSSFPEATMTHSVDVACLDPRPVLLRNAHSANEGPADNFVVGEGPIRSNRTLSSRNRHERLVTELLVPQSESGNKRGSYVQCPRADSSGAGAPIESSKKQGRDGVRRSLRGAESPGHKGQRLPDRERPRFKCWKSGPFSPLPGRPLKRLRPEIGCSALTGRRRGRRGARGGRSGRRGRRRLGVSAVTSRGWRASTPRRRGGLCAADPRENENVAA